MMLDMFAVFAGSAIFLYLGFYLWLCPEAVSEKLKSFFANYPLIRLAGEKQHTSRAGFIKALGLVFITLGVAGLLSLILSKVL